MIPDRQSLVSPQSQLITCQAPRFLGKTERTKEGKLRPSRRSADIRMQSDRHSVFRFCSIKDAMRRMWNGKGR